MTIVRELESDLLGGTAKVIPIIDTNTGNVCRYLVRSEPAAQIINSMDKDEYEVIFYASHAQMCTELVHYSYTGPIAFEVPVNTLYDCIEMYRSIAFLLLQNKVSLKLHIVMTNDLSGFTKDDLLVELSELVALGVELILDNITTLEHIEVATMILEVVEEVRMDLSDKNALGYTHLSSLFSTELVKGKRLGVIIGNDDELPPFSSTYQKNTNFV